MPLVGRSSEREALQALLDGAREGLSGALVLRGNAGVGKTSLLDDAAESGAACGMQIARLTGIESETQLGYAALHRLLLPYSGRLERLPGPQRDALRSTFGLGAGPPADRFMVALGVLTLLADVASDGPLLCLVDDGHWLDPESHLVLGFVARRLDAEKIAMVIATRDAGPLTPSGPLPEMVIGGLSDSEARDLLASVTERTVNGYVTVRLIESTAGNPLALVELVRELTPDQLSGISPLPEPLPVGHSLELMFSRQVSRLPPDSRLLLALAAAEPSAPPATLWRAAAQLGVDPDAASSEAGNLVAFTPRVTFRHPLVCSVVYHLTPVFQRRLIHQALADQGEESDRVAWHLGMATIGPDEAVAARLEQTAECARERGGYAATVTFLIRAAELSASEDLRTRRLLAAAEAALAAGQPAQAGALLQQARSRDTSEQQMATVLRLGGEASFVTGQAGPAARQLLAAAKRLMTIDAPLGRQTLLAALTAAIFTQEDVLDEVRAFATDFVDTPVDLEDPSSTADCLLFAFLYRMSGAPNKAAPLLRAAIGHLRDPATPDAIRMSIPIVVVANAGTELLDENATSDVMDTCIRFARRTGALKVLAPALDILAIVLIRQGRFDDAEEASAEGRALGELTGSPKLAHLIELNLLCWRGREEEARELAARIIAEEERSGAEQNTYHDHLPMYLAVLELGLGRYRQAYDQGLVIFREDRLGFGTLALADFIESAARCHELDVACEALSRLEGRAVASGERWGLGRLARCQALLAGDVAEPFYRSAIDLLEPTANLTDLARTHLLYGEWLRRQRRRRDASVHLRAANDMFVEMGADGFAARAGAELVATGERPWKRSVESIQMLTPQEARIARLVAEGGTNREVAAQLFISPATVDYHLRKVYQKLGITSRTRLARVMPTTN